MGLLNSRTKLKLVPVTRLSLEDQVHELTGVRLLDVNEDRYVLQVTDRYGTDRDRLAVFDGSGVSGVLQSITSRDIHPRIDTTQFLPGDYSQAIIATRDLEGGTWSLDLRLLSFEDGEPEEVQQQRVLSGREQLFALQMKLSPDFENDGVALLPFSKSIPTLGRRIALRAVTLEDGQLKQNELSYESGADPTISKVYDYAFSPDFKDGKGLVAFLHEFTERASFGEKISVYNVDIAAGKANLVARTSYPYKSQYGIAFSPNFAQDRTLIAYGTTHFACRLDGDELKPLFKEQKEPHFTTHRVFGVHSAIGNHGEVFVFRRNGFGFAADRFVPGDKKPEIGLSHDVMQFDFLDTLPTGGSYGTMAGVRQGTGPGRSPKLISVYDLERRTLPIIFG